MLLKKTLTLVSLGVVCAAFSAKAQDSADTAAAKPLLSGYADVYYRYNFGNPKRDAATGDRLTNNFTSFTNKHNSFELNMISLKMEHSIGKVSMVADVGFGNRAEEFSYADNNTKFAIKQLFVSYSPAENLKLTLGSWATHIGYELVDPTGNRNYSMSYLFSYGPFLHTGFKAEYTAGIVGLMAGIANPTDLKSTNFDYKTAIAQISVAPSDNFKAYLSFQGGQMDDSTKNSQLDAVITGVITDKFNIGVNGTYSWNKYKEAAGAFGPTQTWAGAALYLNVDPTDVLGLTLRGEYFSDKDALKVFTAYPGGGSVFESTLSANIRISNLTIIPELRLDQASQSIFVKNSGAATKSTVSALLGAVYRF
ncbi:MAG: porin [Mucilaginibacter polytrichastri]|nr:porin [Mucilaginibacter polytrichastri]